MTGQPVIAIPPVGRLKRLPPDNQEAIELQRESAKQKAHEASRDLFVLALSGETSSRRVETLRNEFQRADPIRWT